MYRNTEKVQLVPQFVEGQDISSTMNKVMIEIVQGWRKLKRNITMMLGVYIFICQVDIET